MDDIPSEEIQNLLKYFSKNLYYAKDCSEYAQKVMQKCIDLVSLDYYYDIVDNLEGQYSENYPSKLILIKSEKVEKSKHSSNGFDPKSSNPHPVTITENKFVNKFKELFTDAKTARCRGRFPFPVIFYKKKNICRSSTLASGIEIFTSSGFRCFEMLSDPSGAQNSEKPSQTYIFDKIRNQDIKLLNALQVDVIVDFMVEGKKVKYGLKVTSSEKVDKENRYSKFTLLSLPYPGCEFFKVYRDNNYIAEDLVFNWNQGYVDAPMVIPDDNVSSKLSIEWENYKNWDLITLTQNYMKIMIQYVGHLKNYGLLIHCISGWDRTPLFISLLRLSLWADGKIHKSLSAAQILYFTVAYDWMLFGHNLPDRLSKGEDIFFFCFNFLKCISGQEYSITSESISNMSTVNEGEHLRTGISNLSLNSLDAGCRISADSTYGGILDNNCIDSQGIESKEIHSSPESCKKSMCLNSRNFSKRTSPMAVPSKTPNSRSRSESTSSLNIGSWQFVSGTGSFRGSSWTSGSGSDSDSLKDKSGSLSTTNDAAKMIDSAATIVEDSDSCSSNSSDTVLSRHERLRDVRELFNKSYFTAIDINLKDGSGFGQIFGNLAGSFGFAASQKT